jgi:hypothetical protein
MKPSVKNKTYIALVLLMASAASIADDIANSDKLLCSTSQLVVCFENGECVTMQPWEIGVPQFVVIDTKKKVISTTKASGENRSTPIRTLQREDATIFLQGVEAGRAFSFSIDEETGLLTVAVSRDGLTVSVFGACTDSDV